MNDSQFFEYIVKPPEKYKKTRRRKILLIVFYCAICIIMALLIVFVLPPELILPVVVTIAALYYVTIRLTWRKTKPEYEYSIVSGVLTLAVIYGGHTRRTLLEIEIKDAELIAPTNGLFDSKLHDFAPENVYRGVFEDNQANYFMLFCDEYDKHSVLYFEASPAAIKLLRRLNGRTVVSFSE